MIALKYYTLSGLHCMTIVTSVSPDNDDAWDNICTHMAWIKEELELNFDD